MKKENEKNRTKKKKKKCEYGREHIFSKTIKHVYSEVYSHLSDRSFFLRMLDFATEYKLPDKIK